MSSYHFTAAANLDIESIGRYICERDPIAADHFLAELDRICELLASHPEIGPLRRELGEGLRSFPVGHYLIFYEPSLDGIDVVRVLYGGRDLSAIFRRPSA